MTPAEQESLRQGIGALALLFSNCVRSLAEMNPREADKLVKAALAGRDYRLQIGQHLRGAASRKRAARLRMEAAALADGVAA